MDFGNDKMADYIFNHVKGRCIFNNNEWYCYDELTG